MPDATRLGSACVMLALFVAPALLSPARAQDGAPRAIPDDNAQPPAINPGPIDPPPPGEAPNQNQVPLAPAAAPLDTAALDSLIAKLDDPALMEREVAMTAIRNTPGLSLRGVEAMMQRTSLSPEQRVRLTQVGQSIFMNEPRAAMGVRFSGFSDEDDGQVQIDDPTPGWDSARVLRPGDVLRAIEGFRIRTQSEARAAIISYDPGDTVSVDILRNGQPGAVRVRLGRFADLQDQRALQRPVLEAAWRLRAARSAPSLAKPIAIGLAEDDWTPAAPGDERPTRMERMNHPITSEPIRTQMREIPVADLTASGASRAAGERETGLGADAFLSNSGRRDGVVNIRINGRGAPGQRVPRDMSRMMLDISRQQRGALQRQIAQIRQMAADPNADAAMATLLRRQAEDLSTQLARLDGEIEELTRDAGDR